MNPLNIQPNAEQPPSNPFAFLNKFKTPSINPLRLTSDNTDEDDKKEEEIYLKYANEIIQSTLGASSTHYSEQDARPRIIKKAKDDQAIAKTVAGFSTNPNIIETVSGQDTESILPEIPVVNSDPVPGKDNASDPTDKRLLSVALTEDFPTSNTLKSLRYSSAYMDEITFRGSSASGYLIDPNASAAQFKELLTVSPSAMKYGTLRLRGGLQGELWITTKGKSQYLRKMFEESPEMKSYIDKWGSISPYATSTTANLAIITTRYTPLDMLADAVKHKPEGWDPKKAIDELKIADPGLATYLFEEIQISEDTLRAQSLTPDHFKYLIADAMDAYAMGVVMRDFTEHNEYAAINTTLWPMLRDSANSSDSFAGYVFMGAGAALTATGVTAEIGIPLMILGAAKIGLNAAETGSKAWMITKRLKAILVATKRLSDERRISAGVVRLRYGVAKASEFLPHQWSETIGKRLIAKVPVLGKIQGFGDVGLTALARKATNGALFETAKDITTGQALAAVPTWAVRTYLAEALEGGIEDVFRQHNAISTGFQTDFSSSSLIQNMHEEGFGGLMLAPVFHGIGHSQRFMLRDMADGLVLKVVKKAYNFSTQKLSEDQKLKIKYFAKIAGGLGEDSELTSRQFVEQANLEYRIHSLSAHVQSVSGLGDILDPDNDHPVVKTALDVLSNGNSDHRGRASLELLGMIGAVEQRLKENNVTLSPKMFVSLVFSIAQRQTREVAAQSGDTSSFSKLLASAYEHHANENNKNRTFSISTDIKSLTDDDITKFAAQLKADGTELLSTLGLKDFDELQSKLVLAKEHQAVLQEIIQEEANNLGKDVSVTSGGQSLPGMTGTTSPKVAATLTAAETAAATASTAADKAEAAAAAAANELSNPTKELSNRRKKAKEKEAKRLAEEAVAARNKANEAAKAAAEAIKAVSSPGTAPAKSKTLTAEEAAKEFNLPDSQREVGKDRDFVPGPHNNLFGDTYEEEEAYMNSFNAPKAGTTLGDTEEDLLSYMNASPNNPEDNAAFEAAMDLKDALKAAMAPKDAAAAPEAAPAAPEAAPAAPEAAPAAPEAAITSTPAPKASQSDRELVKDVIEGKVEEEDAEEIVILDIPKKCII